MGNWEDRKFSILLITFLTPADSFNKICPNSLKIQFVQVMQDKLAKRSSWNRIPRAPRYLQNLKMKNSTVSPGERGKACGRRVQK